MLPGVALHMLSLLLLLHKVIARPLNAAGSMQDLYARMYVCINLYVYGYACNNPKPNANPFAQLLAWY